MKRLLASLRATVTRSTMHLLGFRRPRMGNALGLCAVTAFVAGSAAAAAPPVDESQLLDVGFKVLVAQTKVQEDWVKSLPPGQIRPMQRNGKKYFIYPDAAKRQVYVGGPTEYEAYQQRHPEAKLGAQEAAKAASAARLKQGDKMKEANTRNQGDPFSAADWTGLGW